MRATEALKLSAYYHALALGATLVGGVFVAAGVVLGLGDAVGILTSGPFGLGTIAEAIGALSVIPFLVLTVVGVFVWRVGRTAAGLHVRARALDEEVDVPSTSVISRKVGREVSTAVEEEGFEFGETEPADSDSSDAAVGIGAGTGGDEPSAEAESATGTSGTGVDGDDSGENWSDDERS